MRQRKQQKEQRKQMKDQMMQGKQIRGTMKEKKEDEFLAFLRRVHGEHTQVRAFRYFIEEVFTWYRTVRMGGPDQGVVILGTGIPEELVLAAGATPLHILGGNHDACEWADDLVPRDTDPVSRSLLGYLQCLKSDHLLYLVPLYSDSMRKIAYDLMNQGRKVVTVDFPPDRNASASRRSWTRQMLRMTEAVIEHTGSRVTVTSLRNAVRRSVRARLTLHEFALMAPEYSSVLSPSARILIENSYYYARDLETWTRNLRELMQEMREQIRKHQSLSVRKLDLRQDVPRILLMGSPVLAPNDKVPVLLDQSGLEIWRQADACINIQYIIPKIRNAGRHPGKMIEIIANAWYREDASPAYLTNDSMRRRITSLCEFGQIEGVVCHVLKGQLEPDFELAFYEELLEQFQIPVFRLETDYQYQDIEQLRIRMEAFTEMLNQNRYVHGTSQAV